MSIAAGIWIGLAMSSKNNTTYIVSDSGYNYPSSRITEILRLIEARYLEDEDINALEEEAISSVLKKLDPHSTFISIKDIESVNENLIGNFEGIGVEFFVLDDTVFIVNVIEGGPSDRAGLQDGDKLIYVDDSLIAGQKINNTDVIAKLKGPSESTVRVGVKRAQIDSLLSFDIIRGNIPVVSIDAAYMIDEQTGLIKVNRFSSTTYREFMMALEQLVEQHKLNHLIIDLRGNPGGYLDQATKILSQLFDNKELLVYTEGKKHNRKDYKSAGSMTFPVQKVVVLIDEKSASASEIMAGAIQDNDRGLVIGRRSFGKGLVQEQYDLSDGSALRLTIAKYYTPSGRFIQKPFDDKGSYGYEVNERFTTGELFSIDSVHLDSSIEYQTKSGRVVYGGGGIMPDIFVPVEAIYKSRFFVGAYRFIPSFIYHYIDQKGVTLRKKYETIQAFEAYELPSDMIDQFFDYIHEKGVLLTRVELDTCKNYLLNRLRAEVARLILDDNAFYDLLYRNDPMIQRATKEINR